LFHNLSMNNNIVIIGAGPAGIACGIQLKRYGLEPVIIEKNQVGGLLRNANFVENYPGFPEGITGMAIVDKFSDHLKKYSLSPVFDEVVNVNFNNSRFCVNTQKAGYEAKFLVVASGTKPKKLDITAGNVFYEVCELYKYDLHGKTIAIVGSGDAAFDYALNLAENSTAQKVFVLNRGTKTKCIPVLRQRALQNPKIQYLENTVPDKNAGYDYILAATGRESDAGFLNLQEHPCLFLIGDVKNGHFRQTTIAAGDGIKAAMEIYADISALP